MPRVSRRSSSVGRDPRLKANLVTAAVVIGILSVGVFLLVKAMNYGDEPVRSAVN